MHVRQDSATMTICFFCRRKPTISILLYAIVLKANSKKKLEILIIVHKSHPASILHTITSLPLITTAHYLSLIYQDMSVVVAVIRLSTVSISKPVEGNMTRYASAAAIKPTCSATNVFGPRPPNPTPSNFTVPVYAK